MLIPPSSARPMLAGTYTRRPAPASGAAAGAGRKETAGNKRANRQGKHKGSHFQHRYSPERSIYWRAARRTREEIRAASRSRVATFASVHDADAGHHAHL